MMRSAVALFTFAALSACEAPSTQPAVVSPGESAPATGPAHFTARLDHSTGRLLFTRVAPTEGLAPDSVNPINDPSGANGSPTSADVDLTSPNQCTFPAGQFQCDVEMIWGGPTRSLPNPVIQIDTATIDGVSTNLYDANNSDQSNPLAIAIDHGLWVYTNSGEPNMADPVPSNGPFYLTSKAGTFNTGTRLWSLDDPDGQDVIYDVLVWASLTYSTYGFNFGSASYVDACTGGTVVTASTGSVSLPFDVTVYDQTYLPGQPLRFAKNGQITFGSVGLTAAADPPSGGLPSTHAPEPSFWAFWDDLKLRTAVPKGRMCVQTFPAAPNRTVVVEWRDMDFADAPDEGADLDFEAIIHEGTGEIDTVYNYMTAAPGDTSGREQGAQAWVGVQNASGTKAVGEYEEEDYGTGSSYAYVPKP